MCRRCYRVPAVGQPLCKSSLLGYHSADNRAAYNCDRPLARFRGDFNADRQVQGRGYDHFRSEDGNTAFLIVSGSVEVSVGQEAKAKTVGTLDAGEVFGEMCLIDPGPRSATVKAVTNVECVATSYDEFIASIQSNPEQAMLFMKTLVRRLREMNDRVVSMDPGRRRLRQIFRDWQKSIEPHDGDDRLSMYYWSTYGI